MYITEHVSMKLRLIPKRVKYTVEKYGSNTTPHGITPQLTIN